MSVDSRYAVDDGYGVDEALCAATGWAGVFGDGTPLVVEVGFGNGQSLAEMARRRPESGFVGIELYGKGVQKLCRRLDREKIGNVRVIKDEAFETLGKRFRDGIIDEVHVNFPDPWPKRRHHKRRLVDPAFVELLFAKLRPGGEVFLATDFDCYADQMLEVFEAHPGFVNTAGPLTFRYEMPDRIVTKYERKFSELGATIRYLWYRRTDPE